MIVVRLRLTQPDNRTMAICLALDTMHTQNDRRGNESYTLFFCIMFLFIFVDKNKKYFHLTNPIMKKLFATVLSSLFISSLLVSCGPSTDDAVKYNDALVSEQTKVFEKESALIEAISKNMPEKFDVLLAELSVQVDSSADAVKKMNAFDGKSDLKDAALKVFATYRSVVDSNYRDMIKYAKTPDSLYTQEDDDKVIELSKKIDDKLNKAVEDFVSLQKSFAGKYKFELNGNASENESGKVDKAATGKKETPETETNKKKPSGE
jgi:hypothetical protein